MKTTLTSMALGAALSLTAPLMAQAANYTIDLSHSFIQFETGHLGVSKLSGRPVQMLKAS